MIEKHGLGAFTEAEREAIWYRWHQLDCWPDFPAALAKMRKKYNVASFTILSVSLIVDTAKRNGLSWDTVISCEMIGQYKILPGAYERTAKWLALGPAEIMMVACHNIDLNAARDASFKSGFVRCPNEWGAAGPPDPAPNSDHDIIVDDFPDLVRQLGLGT